MSIERGRRAWNGVRAHLVKKEQNAILSIPRRRGFPHPRDAGARLTATWPVGQIADFLIDGNPPLAVREFPERYEAFLDTAHAATQLLNAVAKEPSTATYVGAAILGGALGSSMSNKRDGMLLGAGLGLLFAAALDASLNDRRRSRR